MRVTDKIVAYYGHFDWPSNFYLSSFWMDDIKFNCVEKAYMYKKAEFFQDKIRMRAILRANEPSVCKALGRQVLGFDENLWTEEREGIMLNAMLSRFNQNKPDIERLISTETKVLVEGSKKDKIWGCGLGVYDDRIEDQTNWHGLNLHGKCLMGVRDLLQKEYE